ncbi:MAG: hypothetical protein EHM78_02095 [Myxococcaceae bacterium]|nr:MAG: hypothetical protein EHM78_02095 [Myxococcaceae bacterium]
MPAPGFSTLLEISGAGLPPYSARGLTQTLAPIQQAAQMRRSINGKLIDVSLPQFKLFASSVSGADQRPPFAYFPGTLVTVRCLSFLSYKTSGGAQERDAVPGSHVVEGAWTYYRPVLVMRVMSFSISEEEWAAGVNWSVALEEYELDDDPS